MGLRAPLSWLRDFSPFDPGDLDVLVAALDDLGLVVEGVERVGEGLGDIVVARVEEIRPIQGADRIRLVTVEAGGGPLEVVCGAWNFAPGDLVPLARVGAVLPGGMEISRRKMKGVVSNGMLCSGRELGLSDDHEGILILEPGGGPVEPGMALTEATGIGPDVVLDISVEGNRPDAWCMEGVARDLAARLHLPFTPVEDRPAPETGAHAEGLASLSVLAPDLCPRMLAAVFSQVTVGPSPRWLARRLVLAGMRPVSNVVDASNYVMLELGQPTHPYDLDRLPGHGLVVRRATKGETIETLDGETRHLGLRGRDAWDTGDDCVICDAEGTPVGIAGIMGGASSEISPATERVLLEAAYFTAMTVARTSKRLGLRTEASARFERGCDPWVLERAVDRFAALLGAVRAPGTLEARGPVPAPITLELPVRRVNDLLGTALGPREIATLLEPIGFSSEIVGDQALTVRVPSNRPDVRDAPLGVADLVEEVARTYGYGRIPRRRPSWPEPGGLTKYQRDRRLVADVLCGIGALEAWTPTLVDDADHTALGLSGSAVAVANPIVREEAWLRRSLLPGLLRALAYNLNRRQGRIRLFEIGTVFEPGATDGRVPAEREMLGVVLAEEADDARAAVSVWGALLEALRLEAVDLVADAGIPGLHPTRTARLDPGTLNARSAPAEPLPANGSAPPGEADRSQRLGVVGEVDPRVAARFGVEGARVAWLEVDLAAVLDPGRTARRPAVAEVVSRYPSTDVDLSFVVTEDVPAAQVELALRRGAGDLVESVALFDVHRGAPIQEGRRGLTYRVRLCSPDHTLTEEEVRSAREAAIRLVEKETGAALRV